MLLKKEKKQTKNKRTAQRKNKTMDSKRIFADAG